MIAIGAQERWHLQLAQRWIVQYNFYINDQHWGRMFVRVCPYLPFSARVCLNQHHWLAKRMRTEGIDFSNVPMRFSNAVIPQKLQQLADSLTAQDLRELRTKMASLSDALLQRQRTQNFRLSAPALFLPSGVLRQPDLSPARCTA